jgi:hypothetical protein
MAHLAAWCHACADPELLKTFIAVAGIGNLGETRDESHGEDARVRVSPTKVRKVPQKSS